MQSGNLCGTGRPSRVLKLGWKRVLLFLLALILQLLPSALNATPTVTVNGSTLTMSNVNVVLQYNLGTGKANFYWKGALKISGFYAGYELTSYITGTSYALRTYSVSNDTVTVTLTGAGLQTMKQYFIFDADDSFLTRLEVDGVALKSNWMGPVVVDTSGYVDIGSYGDDRALFVPFDNDSFVRYNAMPINSSTTGYEVGAFYDNTTRNGLVVGSVTHDTWKTGVYWKGSISNKLVNLNVFGGVTSSNQTRDISAHGQVVGNTILSPLVFVGFGSDWRNVMDNFAAENTNQVPRRVWNGGVPFGWNSWYAVGSSLNYNDAIGVSDFIHTNLQANNFNNNGTVYVNLDSYWDNMTGTQLQSFANNCYANGQNPGIYWSPFVWWGSTNNAATSQVEGSTYNYDQVALKTTNGNYQVIDGAMALDPTHPGTKQRIDYYINMFKSHGFDYLKLDFLTHGALEGVHYDPNVTTGIEAYNQGMQYVIADMGTNMFCSESIAPIFPYQYAHSRRIACDTSTHISETSYEMQSVTYGWWLSGNLYQYNDPDCMKFSGATTDENQSRLISCAVSGTVFLNSDDLTSPAGQALAETCLTKKAINDVARAGRSFVPVEGNSGLNPGNLFVRQDGTTWCVAVFNYATNAVTTKIDLTRAGISGNYIPVDLWSGAVSSISNATMLVKLNGAQAKLFRLFTPPALLAPVASGDGVVSFTLRGDAGFNYAIQSSTNLVQWTKVGTVTNISGQVQFTQTNSSGPGLCFYRGMLDP